MRISKAKLTSLGDSRVLSQGDLRVRETRHGSPVVGLNHESYKLDTRDARPQSVFCTFDVPYVNQHRCHHLAVAMYQCRTVSEVSSNHLDYGPMSWNNQQYCHPSLRCQIHVARPPYRLHSLLPTRNGPRLDGIPRLYLYRAASVRRQQMRTIPCLPPR